MYSAPDKLPKRFSIIQNVCDFTRLSLEVNNSFSISGQCSGDQMFPIPPLFHVCFAVREGALHLVIKIWVLYGEAWTLNPVLRQERASVDFDLSGPFWRQNKLHCLHVFLFFPACSPLIRNIRDPGGITCECAFSVFFTNALYCSVPSLLSSGELRLLACELSRAHRLVITHYHQWRNRLPVIIKHGPVNSHAPISDIFQRAISQTAITCCWHIQTEVVFTLEEFCWGAGLLVKLFCFISKQTSDCPWKANTEYIWHFHCHLTICWIKYITTIN